MEIFAVYLSALATKYPPVFFALTVLGSMVVLGTIYVKVTPTQDDDKWLMKIENHLIWGSLLRLLIRFSIFRRAEKKNESTP
jgi:hypothetical protein